MRGAVPAKEMVLPPLCAGSTMLAKRKVIPAASRTPGSALIWAVSGGPDRWSIVASTSPPQGAPDPEPHHSHRPK
ncbi:MAG TPA: hypothetical protein VFD59_13345 [Nocardioidaceae bacterium]|nr:hypothetical protein [Nocardioidaceae bacterium]